MAALVSPTEGQRIATLYVPEETGVAPVHLERKKKREDKRPRPVSNNRHGGCPLSLLKRGEGGRHCPSKGKSKESKAEQGNMRGESAPSPR